MTPARPWPPGPIGGYARWYFRTTRPAIPGRRPEKGANRRYDHDVIHRDGRSRDPRADASED